ncbi:hypothetical protein HDU76_004370 [Blyttiomyces sp. JEL0837]|nr:hypothetical protein HDU76_004370 [Blyttiomyces sp. JEL0837]
MPMHPQIYVMQHPHHLSHSIQHGPNGSSLPPHGIPHVMSIPAGYFTTAPQIQQMGIQLSKQGNGGNAQHQQQQQHSSSKAVGSTSTSTTASGKSLTTAAGGKSGEKGRSSSSSASSSSKVKAAPTTTTNTPSTSAITGTNAGEKEKPKVGSDGNVSVVKKADKDKASKGDGKKSGEGSKNSDSTTKKVSNTVKKEEKNSSSHGGASFVSAVAVKAKDQGGIGKAPVVVDQKLGGGGVGPLPVLGTFVTTASSASAAGVSSSSLKVDQQQQQQQQQQNEGRGDSSLQTSSNDQHDDEVFNAAAILLSVRSMFSTTTTVVNVEKEAMVVDGGHVQEKVKEKKKKSKKSKSSSKMDVDGDGGDHGHHKGNKHKKLKIDTSPIRTGSSGGGVGGGDQDKRRPSLVTGGGGQQQSSAGAAAGLAGLAAGSSHPYHLTPISSPVPRANNNNQSNSTSTTSNNNSSVSLPITSAARRLSINAIPTPTSSTSTTTTIPIDRIHHPSSLHAAASALLQPRSQHPLLNAALHVPTPSSSPPRIDGPVPPASNASTDQTLSVAKKQGLDMSPAGRSEATTVSQDFNNDNNIQQQHQPHPNLQQHRKSISSSPPPLIPSGSTGSINSNAGDAPVEFDPRRRLSHVLDAAESQNLLKRPRAPSVSNIGNGGFGYAGYGYGYFDSDDSDDDSEDDGSEESDEDEEDVEVEDRDGMDLDSDDEYHEGTTRNKRSISKQQKKKIQMAQLAGGVGVAGGVGFHGFPLRASPPVGGVGEKTMSGSRSKTGGVGKTLKSSSTSGGVKKRRASIVSDNGGGSGAGGSSGTWVDPLMPRKRGRPKASYLDAVAAGLADPIGGVGVDETVKVDDGLVASSTGGGAVSQFSNANRTHSVNSSSNASTASSPSNKSGSDGDYGNGGGGKVNPTKSTPSSSSSSSLSSNSVSGVNSTSTSNVNNNTNNNNSTNTSATNTPTVTRKEKLPTLPKEVSMSWYRDTSQAPPVTWSKGGPMAFGPGTHMLDQLSKEEVNLCKTLRLFPQQYIQIKETVVAASYTHPPFRKKEVRRFLDLNWVPQTDEEWDRRREWLKKAHSAGVAAAIAALPGREKL